MSSRICLLDTNIVSYLWKEHSLASAYRARIADSKPTISFITVGELYRWARESKWGARRRAWMEERLTGYFMIPIDQEMARVYATVTAARRRSGRPIDLHDAWIAACALRHGLPLVTHNRRDFDGIPDLEVISEAAPA